MDVHICTLERAQQNNKIIGKIESISFLRVLN